MKSWLLILFVVAMGLGGVFLLFEYRPQPPAGVCDGTGTPEECTEWWHDLMECS